MSTELEHLRKMRELLAKGWTQNLFACFENGLECGEMHPQAVAFSLTASAMRAAEITGTPDYFPSSLRKALNETAGNPIGYSISMGAFNTAKERKKEEVLALIDRAIEIAEAAQ